MKRALIKSLYSKKIGVFDKLSEAVLQLVKLGYEN
jgi:hypothetical protein